MENFIQVQLFTEEECSRILEMPVNLVDRSTMSSYKPDWFHGNLYRGTLDRVIQPEGWVKDRLKSLLRLEGYGTLEGFWPLIYKEYADGTSMSELGYHTDSAKGIKRAGVTIPLNADYVGGEFQFLQWGKGMYDNEVFSKSISTNIGLATIFPIFIPHRVTKVTAGIRKQLVTWLTGPQLNW